ncbi:hypothetical protein [Azospirillum humicireducens]|uniref:hypothetical protein n=1 Tax=Azospirillum humicireducens TaxID=1226968 RepID=UPI000AD2518D|nr:hypothetical protein [Azospirillum humicireducens]
MDTEVAKNLIASLLDRIEIDPSSGKKKLLGLISDREIAALHHFSGIEEPVTSSVMLRQRINENPLQDEKTVQVKLNLDSLDKAVEEGIILCLDFGTAFSKACAMTDGEDLVDLPLGKKAGEEGLVYPVNSTIYFADGRIWFGPQAIKLSERDQDPKRQRFDSPKQAISQGDFENIQHRFVDDAINPTSVKFTVSDLIQLYLAYLTAIATACLEDAGHSAYVRRRFARPSWPADQAEWANRELSSMMARAQILADTWRNRWADGLLVEEARFALDELKKLTSEPAQLIIEPVLEATAAGNSALRRASPSRSLCMVVDAGAGTCDFGLFYIVRINDTLLRVAEVSGSSVVLRQAGDTVDRMLVDAILAKEALRIGSAEYDNVLVDLKKRIRGWKEKLFRDGHLDYQLTNDGAGVIKVSEFLARDEVRRFQDALERRFRESLEGISDSWNAAAQNGRIHVLLTGGSANLPMVKQLSEGVVEANGTHFLRERLDALPDWIGLDYPELVPEFGQLAVCIGGAAENLPRLTGVYTEFGGAAPPGARYIPPASKG